MTITVIQNIGDAILPIITPIPAPGPVPADFVPLPGPTPENGGIVPPWLEIGAELYDPDNPIKPDNPDDAVIM